MNPRGRGWKGDKITVESPLQRTANLEVDIVLYGRRGFENSAMSNWGLA